MLLKNQNNTQLSIRKVKNRRGIVVNGLILDLVQLIITSSFDEIRPRF